MDQTLIAATVFSDTAVVTADAVTLLVLGLVLLAFVIRLTFRQPRRPGPEARRRRAAILELHREAMRRHAAMQQMIEAFGSRRAY